MSTKIQGAILAAMREIASTGIAKAAQANLGGANVRYRGIEAAMNAMSGVLVTNGIIVTPSYSELQIAERAKAEAGKATRFATLRGSFKFEADDGSFVLCEAYGEAMDSGDKAVVKAQSVAFRTALFQQFVVPTQATAIDPEEGGDDGYDEDGELETLREIAKKGEAALRTYYEEMGVTEALWKKHGKTLKEAAKKADAERKVAA